MKNYDVVTELFKKFEKGERVFHVVIMADTADDVPDKNYSEEEPDKVCAPFSVCYIADSGDCKILNTQGVWCNV